MQILLTGGSGLLGTELIKLTPEIDAPSHQELDICDAAAVAHYVASSRPKIILHAAAITNNRDIEADPAEAIDVNIKGTANLVQACIGTRIRLVFLSTDYVYKGDRGDYRESDEVLPCNLYAWSKLAGEAAVRAVPNHLIIRTSFGRTQFDYPVAFIDKWSSKDYVDLLAPKLLKAACSPLTGVVNIGGSRRTIHEYAIERNPEIAAIERADSTFDSPADTSMNQDIWNAYETGGDIVRRVTECRVCASSDLVEYLDLGLMPLANNLASTARDARHMQRFPMQVQFCTDCSLSMLSIVIDPGAMFSHYTYRSSINKGYKEHCRQMAKSVADAMALNSEDLVVDIAGNDGTLLAEFRVETGVRVVNVDPAKNIAKIAESRGIPTYADFWSKSVAQKIVSSHGKARLITATNVFAHVDDVRAFVAAAKFCLDQRGALLLEFPYGVDFIEEKEFDTIYFEHLSYVLINPVCRLAADLQMQVFDVQKQDIHGGTVRVFMGAEGQHDIQPSVAEFLDYEKRHGFHDVEIYQQWNKDINLLIKELRNQVISLQAGGSRIAGFAASAKGNTLLNACGLDAKTVEYIVDDTPEKIGKFSPGTGIPVVGREKLEDDPPDYLIVLAWNFAREIVSSTAAYRAGGGRYIIPIPGFRVIDHVEALSHE